MVKIEKKVGCCDNRDRPIPINSIGQWPWVLSEIIEEKLNSGS